MTEAKTEMAVVPTEPKPAEGKNSREPLNTKEVQLRSAGGGALFMPKSMSEIVTLAQLMAKGGPAVAVAFQNEPGPCLAVAMQALRWEMDPFAVINQAYVTKDKSGNPRIAYMAQLIAAVVNTRAPFKQRPTLRFEGEHDEMRCTVSAVFRGEEEVRILNTPHIKDIAVKNSPLWKADPEQQLSYYALRAFGRRWCPEVLLGVYTPEEIQNFGPENAVDVTPKLDSDVMAPPRPRLSEFEREAATPKKTGKKSGKKKESAAPPTEEPKQEQAAAAPTVEITAGPETTLDRGRRLLSGVASNRDVADLHLTILEELETEADKTAWTKLCEDRSRELRKP